MFAAAASFSSGLAEAAKQKANEAAAHAIAARRATYGDAADGCYDTIGQTCTEMPGKVGDAAGQVATMTIAARRATYGDTADTCYETIGQTCAEMHENVADAAEQWHEDMADVATIAKELPGNAANTAGQVGTMVITARRATYGDTADACYEMAYDGVRDAADALSRFVGGADEAPLLASLDPMEVFVDEVEKPELGDLRTSSAKTVERHTGIKLPDGNQEERNIQLILAYTRETPLYKEMNLGLRTNDQNVVRQYAGYIRELRDAFAVHLPHAVISAFSGTVYRGIQVPNPAEVLASYVVDQDYVWPSFTSTSTSEGFSGNVQFEIVCPPLPADHEGYAPANIKNLSAFPTEDEILFPPHMKLRVVNIQGNKVMMETTAFPSVWKMVEYGDWDGVEKWVEMNPDRVKVKGTSKSLAETIANSFSLGTVPESIQGMLGITPALCANFGDTCVGAVGSLATVTSESFMNVTGCAGSMVKGGE